MRPVAFLSVMILVAAPGVLRAQGTIHIDFDDLTAPCDLAPAYPLWNEYYGLGVVFLPNPPLGGGAVLDECSGLGLPGYSSPNFVVIDPGGTLANGEAPSGLWFVFMATGLPRPEPGPTRVRLAAGGTPGITVTMECEICDFFEGCKKETSIVLTGSEMQTIELQTPYEYGWERCRVEISDGIGTAIIDDLEAEFAQEQAAAIPAFGVFGGGVLAVLLMAVGVLVLRRTVAAG